MRWTRVTCAAVTFVLVLVSCAVDDGEEAFSAPSTTSSRMSAVTSTTRLVPAFSSPAPVSTDVVPAATSTTTTVITTATTSLDLATPSLEQQALGLFREWTAALALGNYEGAWMLMAPSSRDALGSYEFFLSLGSELTEGWGSWSGTPELSISIEEDLAGRTMAVIGGLVQREGMVEDTVTTVFLVEGIGGVAISPFEEFGNVSVGLADPNAKVPLPAGSGAGRRIVYANAQQRIWIVEDDGTIVDTYLVSGREGVPAVGVYEVFSKSETAFAGHDGITMRFMVRFTRASSGIAIGFHSIPNYANGQPMQTEEELGEFHSAGCVRQSLGHAAALYEWASIGTPVHVLA